MDYFYKKVEPKEPTFFKKVEILFCLKKIVNYDLQCPILLLFLPSLRLMVS